MSARGRTAPSVAAVILAAGRGTRMGSERAKVLQLLAGRTLLSWACRAVRPVVGRVVVVVGHDRDAVRASVLGEPDGEDVRFAVQEEQLGTGHAVRCAGAELGDIETVVVLAGDVPGLGPDTVRSLLAEHETRGAMATVVTFRAADPTGYGRILRDEDGAVRGIVEERDVTPEQARIAEGSSGILALRAAEAVPRLERLRQHPSGEVMLTDLVGLAVAEGLHVAAVEAPEAEVAGINTPDQLAAAEARFAGRPPEA